MTRHVQMMSVHTNSPTNQGLWIQIALATSALHGDPVPADADPGCYEDGEAYAHGMVVLVERAAVPIPQSVRV